MVKYFLYNFIDNYLLRHLLIIFSVTWQDAKKTNKIKAENEF